MRGRFRRRGGSFMRSGRGRRRGRRRGRGRAGVGRRANRLGYRM